MLTRNPNNNGKEINLNDVLIARENRWNENYIKQKNKIYSKKFKLEKTNIYEKAFKYLNNEIKQKIDLNEKKRVFLTNDEIPTELNYFQLNKYETIYKTGSKALMKFIKSKKFINKNCQNFQLPIIKKIKNINIAEETKKIHNYNKYDYVKPKLWGYSDVVDFTHELTKNKISFERKFNSLKNKFIRNSKSLSHKKFKSNSVLNLVDTNDNIIQDSFSRNSYLVSLNYDFTNPIVI
jgi:hypothetical protein